MGIWDGYVLRTDPSGALLWTQTFGGANDDRGFAIEATSEGDAIVAGWAWSFGAGMGDAYLAKIDDSATTNQLVITGHAAGGTTASLVRVLKGS
jgi:hypothetical protein